MKKSLLILFFVLLAAQAVGDELRVIPHPEGPDTTREGASSASSSINHKFSIYFDTLTDYFELASSENCVILSHYPTYQQTTEVTCGPAAALTVLYYFGEKSYTEKILAEEMKTDPSIGTNPKDMQNFFNRIGWKTESNLTREHFKEYEAFQKFVIENLKQGVPIIVENVDWGGHWCVIIGYDTMGTETVIDDVLILVDPYDTCDHKQDGYVAENAEKFFYIFTCGLTMPIFSKNKLISLL